MIQRQKGVAMWRQIADRVRANIAAGDYDESGKLPPETQLAESFGVNRHTVRAALAALAQEGVVRAEQGRGTLIERRDKFDFPITRRTRFTDAIGEQARALTGRLLSAAIEPADEELARWLRTSTGDRLQRLDVVRLADGRALSRSTSWFPATRFSGIDQAFRESQSITKALKACGVADYVRERTEISAVHADPDDVADLGLTPGAIVLVTKALNVDPDGVAIQFSITRFAADRVQLSITS
ncbi:phosphonate metabolism transcriptional regulator PhnF [Rhizobium sp. SSA_523]|uniref:phosphonate metabolism transcriptional regulator PhnF n=1 Tax=Rhizobium sp. SSA_523 TaxID=2952477 RepID=UPI002090866F|nr:phosphonate metabolism transcriptional regulator PhnF [Rhizobium sp. SSA_523]MCO5733205.1 phosphonate metabolism transcriptional regulator PhnF [Rhizobium sp. SSA_523]WKC21804.1 phosphonate metabolism transcriptional regulator PhnF [Rhizobium sp. SSA_523]